MNEAETELLAAVARVVQVFDALGVDYFVGGSVASSLFGEPRHTMDADLVARLLLQHCSPFVGQLSGEFYLDLGSMTSAVQNQRSFNLIHLKTMMKVDVFVGWRSAFGQSQLRVARKSPWDKPRQSTCSSRHQKMSCWPNLTGTARVEKFRTDSGVICLG
jgi:hypothetical protein